MVGNNLCPVSSSSGGLVAEFFFFVLRISVLLSQS